MKRILLKKTKKITKKISVYCAKHRNMSFIFAAMLLHLSVLWLWPGISNGSSTLSMPARVVQLMNLSVTRAVSRIKKIKVDELKLEITKKNSEEKKVKKIKQQSSGDTFLPFDMVDAQPRPLVPIHSILSYPDQAKRLGIKGIVVVDLDIDEKGKVCKINIVRRAGWGFDSEILRKLPLVRFRPALKDREPVAVTIRLPVEFRLE